MSVPLFLGLSHIYGECESLDASVEFWCREGFEKDFQWNLDVPPAKISLLEKSSKKVLLSYLRPSLSGPKVAIEFLKHSGSDKNSALPKKFPLLKIAGHAEQSKRIVDGLGNTMILDPAINKISTLVAQTAKRIETEKFIQLLGFKDENILPNEAKVLEIRDLKKTTAWILSHPLFSNKAVRIILEENLEADPRPMVDRPGWTGLSILTSDVDKVGELVPLVGLQEISESNGKRRVAFSNSSGLLIEFLEIIRG